MQMDAQTFASWGVDLVKFDGCNFDPNYSYDAYSAFGNFLNGTGRPIIFACEWPLYEQSVGKKVPVPPLQTS